MRRTAFFLLALATLATASCDSRRTGGEACPGVSCGNFGVCVLTVEGQMTCACLAGYHAEGLTCVADTSAACQDVDCGANGICTESNGATVCTCEAGFHDSGGACVADGGDACTGVDCGESGQCFLNGPDPACNCDAGFHAVDLSCVANDPNDPCLGVDCGAGTCAIAQGQPLCACDEGYHAVGLTCAVDAKDPCDGVGCSLHGACVDDGGTAACDCDEGYHADGLECLENAVSSVCDGVVCGPNGSCYDKGGQAACDCDVGFHAEGTACVADEVDPCKGIGCGLHGECVNDAGTAVCDCESGYHAEGLDCVKDAVVASAPVILSYTANNKTMDPTRTLILTAVVTDPDGIDDLIGGSVSDPVSGGSYGAFATAAAEGSYSITITWNQIQEVRALDTAMGGEDRVFEAVFYDQAGHQVTETIKIHMECNTNPSWALCGGACTDLMTSLSSCGKCYAAVTYTKGMCSNGKPACQEGLDLCGNDCVDLSKDKDHCGTCTHDCDAVAGPNGWLVDYQTCQEGSCWVYIEFNSQKSCDSLCASKGLSCLEVNSMSCKASGVSGSMYAACAYYSTCGDDDPEYYDCATAPPAKTTWCSGFSSVSCSCKE